ncbi:MAG: TlpA disulfide reductase family protein [Chitinophagaceae bacterium]
MNRMIRIYSLLLFLSVSFYITNAQPPIGSDAPEIKLPDSLGKWKPLSEVSSKLILIDFWAAWCYPCVKYMPDVVALYEKYKQAGLEVYAISLDKNYYHWVDMCRKLKLPFLLVNDAYGMQGKACKDYAISSIPNKILIENGKIIASNMSLYDMEKVIQKKLNK